MRCDSTSAFSVHLHVSLAADGRGEHLAAVGTLEGSYGAMNHHVACEGAVGGEGGLADVTAEVLHARVGLDVGLQHTHRHKVAAALTTLVRLLSCSGGARVNDKHTTVLHFCCKMAVFIFNIS